MLPEGILDLAGPRLRVEGEGTARCHPAPLLRLGRRGQGQGNFHGRGSARLDWLAFAPASHHGPSRAQLAAGLGPAELGANK
eukprot:5569253-Pyramimonas_sp.AAC.1